MQSSQPSTRRVIIVGASSGIGAELARLYARDGARLGLIARRQDCLEALCAELGPGTEMVVADAANLESLSAALDLLDARLGGADTLIYNAGINYMSREWKKETEVLAVNNGGFVVAATWVHAHFRDKPQARFAGISSIAAIRGSGPSPIYGATKAFMCNYLEGMRKNLFRSGQRWSVSDIRPGFIDTDMTRGQKGMFWVAALDKATRQIYRAIEDRKRVTYVTRRWRLIAWVMRVIPEKIYYRV